MSGIGASFMFFPVEFILHAQWMTAAEVGEYMLETLTLVQNREYAKAQKRLGVGRIYKGTQKREHIPMPIRRQVLSIGYCLFCGSTDRLSIDHIIPVSKGGGNEITNLQCLCFPCNLKKSDKL